MWHVPFYVASLEFFSAYFWVWVWINWFVILLVNFLVSVNGF